MWPARLGGQVRGIFPSYTVRFDLFCYMHYMNDREQYTYKRFFSKRYEDMFDWYWYCSERVCDR